MHVLGIGGQMRRIYDPPLYDFLKGQQPVNVFITVAAVILATTQILFLLNFFVSIFAGKKATEDNPWHATTLEWGTPCPPGHGNFTGELPTVYRWAFDYGVPGAPNDFVMQTTAPDDVANADGKKKH
jgi:cytochrome c oxidase subunit 1